MASGIQTPKLVADGYKHRYLMANGIQTPKLVADGYKHRYLMASRIQTPKLMADGYKHRYLMAGGIQTPKLMADGIQIHTLQHICNVLLCNVLLRKSNTNSFPAKQITEFCACADVTGLVSWCFEPSNHK